MVIQKLLLFGGIVNFVVQKKFQMLTNSLDGGVR